jgi:cell division protein FtsI (penicillin-binding protein 3)
MALRPKVPELRLERKLLLALGLSIPLLMSLTGFGLSLQGTPVWPGPASLPVQRGAILSSEGAVLAEGSAEARRYPHGRLAAHLIGFSGALQPDGRFGLEGLEYSMDAQLQSGEPVRITIDPVIQAAAERHLNAAATRHAAASGAVAIIEAGTGRILAAASYPTFNPDENPAASAQDRLVNRVFLEAYEPGSVMKPFVIAALLEDNRLSVEESIPAEMTRRVGDKTFRDVTQHGPILSVQDILRFSSNTGMIKLTERFTSDELYSWFANFGFGQDLRVEGMFTRSGILNPWERWVPQDHASATIGQSLSTTVLQLATAYSIFANDGLLVQPRLLEAAEVQPPRRVLTSRVAQELRSMLTYTVDESGLRNSRLPNIKVAGKTGTADIFDRAEGRYLDDAFALTFVGMFPATLPEVTIVVSLQRTLEGSTSTAVAAPLFREIGSEVAARLGINPKPEFLAKKR